MVSLPSELFSVKNKWKCNSWSCTLQQTLERPASLHQAHNSIFPRGYIDPVYCWPCVRQMLLACSNLIQMWTQTARRSQMFWNFAQSLLFIYLSCWEFSSPHSEILMLHFKEDFSPTATLIQKQGLIILRSQSDQIQFEILKEYQQVNLTNEGIIKNVCCTNRWINNTRAVCMCGCLSYLYRVEVGNSIDVPSQACR